VIKFGGFTDSFLL